MANIGALRVKCNAEHRQTPTHLDIDIRRPSCLCNSRAKFPHGSKEDSNKRPGCSKKARSGWRLTSICLAGPERPPADQHETARLAVFVSGGGSNFRAIHAACADGRIDASVEVVVSDAPGCGAVEYAKSHGIAIAVYPSPKNAAFEGLTAEELMKTLKSTHRIDYVLLAGYLKLVPDALVAQYKRAMLNIHPGLLPAFGGKGMYGQRVHQAVISSGARWSGPTVHFVDEEYDTGPILAQRVVPVYPTDSVPQLAARVLKEEHQLYPEAIAALTSKRVTWREDGIPIIWSAH